MDRLSISNDFEQWLRFVMSQTHVLREYPHLLLQQGLNQPQQTAVTQQAENWLNQNPRPWLKWKNAPREEFFFRMVLVGHSDAVNAVAVTPDGQQIISGSEDKTIKIWDTATGEEFQTLAGHSAGVTALLIAPGGKRLFSGSSDWTIKIWDFDSGLEENVLIAHKGTISSLDLTDDQRHLISTSSADGTKVWDIRSAKTVDASLAATILQSVAKPSSSSDHEVLTPDGSLIITALGNNIIVRDATELKLPRSSTSTSESKTSDHRTAIKDVALAPDAGRAFTLADEIVIWNVVETRESGTVRPQRGCHRIELTPDGRYLLALGEQLQVFEAASGKKLSEAKAGHGVDGIYAVAITPGGDQLFSVGADSCVRLWTFPQIKVEHTTKFEHGPISLVRTGADGRFIISAGGTSSFSGLPIVSTMGVADQMAGSADTKINVLDRKGKLLFCLEGHSDRVLTAAFTVCGSKVISGSRDRRIKIWDLDTRKEITTLTGHRDAVNRIIVSPDGDFFVSESSDTVRVWSTNTYQPLASLNQATGNSLCCLSSDARYIITQCRKMLNVWSVQSGEISHRFAAHDQIEKVQSLDDVIVVGDAKGRLYFLTFSGSQIGSRILTPLASPNGCEITCPYCHTSQELPHSAISQQCICGSCSRTLRLSSHLVTRSRKTGWRFW